MLGKGPAPALPGSRPVCARMAFSLARQVALLTFCFSAQEGGWKNRGCEVIVPVEGLRQVFGRLAKGCDLARAKHVGKRLTS